MVKFVVGKKYTIDYDKALKTYDLNEWSDFKNEIILFKKRGPRKLTHVSYETPIKEEHAFVVSLIFEKGYNEFSWGYTEDLASLFVEWKGFEQEEMEV